MCKGLLKENCLIHWDKIFLRTNIIYYSKMIFFAFRVISDTMFETLTEIPKKLKKIN